MVGIAGLPEPVDVAAGGERLHVRQLGRGPRLLWLHGGPGLDHHLLLPLALPLAESFEVWLPDLPGHGHSPPQRKTRLGASEIRDRLIRWLTGLERRQGRFELLCGHSLGAWFTRQCLANDAVVPRGTLLLSPPAGHSDRGSPVREGLRLAPRPFRAADPEAELRRSREELLEWIQVDLGSAPSARMREAVGRSNLLPPWRYGTLLRQLHRIFLRPTPQLSPGHPVLVLCGDRDPVTPEEQAREIARSTAGARLELLPAAGHFPFAGEVDGLVERVLSFYRSLPAERPVADRPKTK